MLSQVEADYLVRVAKQINSAKVIVVPAAGGHDEWQATSVGGKDRFHLHMQRGRKVSTKVTLQERYETNEILLRLDIDGPTHGNPDGTVVPTPHLHIYREAFDDKWAFAVPPDLDISSGNPVDILASFLVYCGVVEIPPIQGGVLL